MAIIRDISFSVTPSATTIPRYPLLASWSDKLAHIHCLTNISCHIYSSFSQMHLVLPADSVLLVHSISVHICACPAIRLLCSHISADATLLYMHSHICATDAANLTSCILFSTLVVWLLYHLIPRSTQMSCWRRWVLLGSLPHICSEFMQTQFTAALPLGSSHTESCGEPHKTREAPQDVYRWAFACPHNLLHVTTELLHCFHG